MARAVKGKKRKYVAPKKPNGKLDVGRPEVEIDLKRLKEMARFMYTERELAVCLNVSYTTFKAKKAADPAIAEAIEEGYSMGGASIRSMQMKKAMDGNIPMLKWVGVQYLGQMDKVSHDGLDAPEKPVINVIISNDVKPQK
jgi:hypothetical protein